MTLSASADIEVYLGGGISDLETARHLSAKLGNQTLELEDHLTQERASRAMREAMHDALFRNANPLRTGLSLKALDYERSHKRKMARAAHARRNPDHAAQPSAGHGLGLRHPALSGGEGAVLRAESLPGLVCAKPVFRP